LDANTWSQAEVYAHILAANTMTARGLMKIIEKTATLSKDNIGIKAKLLLWSGRFPKGRKVPAVVEARTPKINSIQEAMESINTSKNAIAAVMSRQAEWNRDYKLKHPALGMLTIEQWIRFMCIHTKHHWKQLDRVS